MPTKKKQRIPPLLRTDVFYKWSNGKRYMPCFCCRRNIISIDNFECGHIVAESLGGELKESNLRPICTPCNRSMGITNMFIYIDKFGFWKNREYPEKCICGAIKEHKCKNNQIKCKNNQIKSKNSLKDIVKCILIINNNEPMHYKKISKDCFDNQKIYDCQLKGKTPSNTISRILTTNSDCFTRTDSGTYKLTNSYLLTKDYSVKLDMCIKFIDKLMKNIEFVLNNEPISIPIHNK
jgi:hypothetical protein